MRCLATAALLVLASRPGLAGETHHAVVPGTVNSAGTTYQGEKGVITVGQFSNRSTYMRGVFSDSTDRLGEQAKGILVTHLQQTGRFRVLDRANMAEMANEAALLGQQVKLKGARYIITGEVAEFGRKEVGDTQMFGILGQGKKQIAYAVVDVKVVDVTTSEVVYSTRGAGEYALGEREVLGFGSTMGYDSTLNGKVLDLAIREAVNRLVEGVDQNRWQP
jgi:curli biogenesis system outer membrane secretion channel CsgG